MSMSLFMCKDIECNKHSLSFFLSLSLSHTHTHTHTLSLSLSASLIPAFIYLLILSTYQSTSYQINPVFAICIFALIHGWYKYTLISPTILFHVIIIYFLNQISLSPLCIICFPIKPSTPKFQVFLFCWPDFFFTNLYQYDTVVVTLWKALHLCSYS